MKTTAKILICTLLLLSGKRISAEEKQDDTPESSSIKVPYSFDDVSKNLVIITCSSSSGGSAGSGFVAKMDEKTYIFTNQHVIMGAAGRIEFKTVTGEQLAPKKVELSVTRDIARLLIDDREDALKISGDIKTGCPIAVFGNSEGAGVATELYGETSSYGPDLIEVTAEFVSGNSGSPVLNAEKEVIGIASYVRYSQPNRTTENTRFENATRRFCYRMTNVKFVPVNWKNYNQEFGIPYRENASNVEALFEIIDELFEDPLTKISENRSDPDLQSWANKHNHTLSRSDNKRRGIGDSTEELIRLCERKALSLESKLNKQNLTGFLRNEYEGQVASYKYAAEILDYFRTKLGR